MTCKFVCKSIPKSDGESLCSPPFLFCFNRLKISHGLNMVLLGKSPCFLNEITTISPPWPVTEALLPQACVNCKKCLIFYKRTSDLVLISKLGFYVLTISHFFFSILFFFSGLRLFLGVHISNQKKYPLQFFEKFVFSI